MSKAKEIKNEYKAKGFENLLFSFDKKACLTVLFSADFKEKSDFNLFRYNNKLDLVGARTNIKKYSRKCKPSNIDVSIAPTIKKIEDNKLYLKVVETRKKNNNEICTYTFDEVIDLDNCSEKSVLLIITGDKAKVPPTILIEEYDENFFDDSIKDIILNKNDKYKTFYINNTSFNLDKTIIKTVNSNITCNNIGVAQSIENYFINSSFNKETISMKSEIEFKYSNPQNNISCVSGFREIYDDVSGIVKTTKYKNLTIEKYIRVVKDNEVFEFYFNPIKIFMENGSRIKNINEELLVVNVKYGYTNENISIYGEIANVENSLVYNILKKEFSYITFESYFEFDNDLSPASGGAALYYLFDKTDNNKIMQLYKNNTTGEIQISAETFTITDIFTDNFEEFISFNSSSGIWFNKLLSPKKFPNSNLAFKILLQYSDNDMFFDVEDGSKITDLKSLIYNYDSEFRIRNMFGIPDILFKNNNMMLFY